MSYTEYCKQQAATSSRRAGNCTRRAEKYAREAAEFYTTARRWARMARRPMISQFAIDYDRNAATWTRIGDTFLRMSFRETERAAEELARAARLRAEAKAG